MKKQLYFFTLILIFLYLPFISFGQGGYTDVVYLKNGSIIRGMIIEQVPNKSIKIQTSDNNIFVYQIDEIEKMTREQVAGSEKSGAVKTGAKGGQGTAKKGFSLGMKVGLDLSRFSGFDAQVIDDILVSQVSKLGFMLGVVGKAGFNVY